MNPAPIFLAGATATGKSAVALALAERLGGEIITVDSMQVYRGLDLGTAKPTAAERARVPHHLLDVAELTESFDAARFVALAWAAEIEIRSRGHIPIFCGGTGLYFNAWFDGVGEAPPGSPELRAQLEATPLHELLDELAARDPETFARIDRQNPRRVVRAVEVIRLTGQPFSRQRAAWQAAQPATVFCLARQPADLRTRIDARVADMFRRGLVEETRALLGRGLEQNRTAMQAIGYRQVVEHVRGERGLPETVALVQTKTRQLAKRQGTWFRRQLNCTWIEVAPEASPVELAEVIERNVRDMKASPRHPPLR